MLCAVQSETVERHVCCVQCRGRLKMDGAAIKKIKLALRYLTGLDRTGMILIAKYAQ